VPCWFVLAFVNRRTPPVAICGCDGEPFVNIWQLAHVARSETSGREAERLSRRGFYGNCCNPNQGRDTTQPHFAAHSHSSPSVSQCKRTGCTQRFEKEFGNVLRLVTNSCCLERAVVRGEGAKNNRRPLSRLGENVSRRKPTLPMRIPGAPGGKSRV